MGLIVVLAVVAVFFLIFRSGALFVVATMDYVTGRLASRSGVSLNLVRSLVIVFTIPFFWAVAKYTQGIFKLRRLKPSLALYTNPYGVIIVCYVAAFFLSMYFASRNAYSYKWCADTPEGVRAFDAPGVDPIYGIKLKRCTPAQIVSLRREEVVLPEPKRIEIPDPSHFAFFDPITGAPRVWYHRSKDGSYEFYDRAGKDPETDADLQPIDAQTRAALIRLQQQRGERNSEVKAQEEQRAAWESAAKSERQHADFMERNLNTAVVRHNGTKQVGVLIFTEDGRELPSAETYALSRVSADGAQPVYSLFRPAFVANGRAVALFNGDWNEARQLDLAARIEYLLLGLAKVSYGTNTQMEGMSTATLNMDLKALNTGSHTVVENLKVTAVGTGFTQPEALDNAIIHAQPQLAGFIKSLF